MTGWATGLGVVLVALLILVQVYLLRRCHRVLNPAVAAATVGTVVLLLVALPALTSAREHLRVAKKDAFDSVYALSQPRAISYDANADESRYLVDPVRAADYEKAFADKTRQLVGLGAITVQGYDVALAEALDQYHADGAVVFGGRYGTALRNITFDGERDAADETLKRLQDYQRADRRIRTLNMSGDLAEAIRFCLSYSPGDSNAIFDTYDTALLRFIDVNSRAFDNAVAGGDEDLSRWTWLAPVALAAIASLMLAGLRPRWAEYRA